MVSIPPCTCGSGKAFNGMLQDQRLMQFLMGLNESYKIIRGNLLMMNPLPLVAQAYQVLVQ